MTPSQTSTSIWLGYKKQLLIDKRPRLAETRGDMITFYTRLLNDCKTILAKRLLDAERNTKFGLRAEDKEEENTRTLQTQTIELCTKMFAHINKTESDKLEKLEPHPILRKKLNYFKKQAIEKSSTLKSDKSVEEKQQLRSLKTRITDVLRIAQHKAIMRCGDSSSDTRKFSDGHHTSTDKNNSEYNRHATFSLNSNKKDDKNCTWKDENSQRCFQKDDKETKNRLELRLRTIAEEHIIGGCERLPSMNDLQYLNHRNAKIGDENNLIAQSRNPEKNVTKAKKDKSLKYILLVDKNRRGKKMNLSRLIYPQSPTKWCEQILPTETKDLVNMLIKREKTLVSRKSITNATQQAASEIHAVTGLDSILTLSLKNLNSFQQQRIYHHLGPNGIMSANINIAIDSAKALSKLKCNEGVVINGLQDIIQREGKGRFAHECAKALLLLGSWDEKAIEILTTCLNTSNYGIQSDALNTIKKSLNDRPMLKKSTSLTSLINSLLRLLRHSDDNIALSAALCLCYLNISNESAKEILLKSLENHSYKSKNSALKTLVKELNLKSDVVVDNILSQISGAYSWRHRHEAVDLMRIVGVDALTEYGVDKIFPVLYRLLSNHPSVEFRSKIAGLLSDMDLKRRTCDVVLTHLHDKNDRNRSKAIIALTTLGLKEDRVLKALLDMFDLDSNNYIRSLLIQAFVNLKWNHPRIMKLLQERQKGDGSLAHEAYEALNCLLSA